MMFHPIARLSAAVKMDAPGAKEIVLEPNKASGQAHRAQRRPIPTESR